ncbi:Bug family tripartite tricarboxylate transporter substrate binding protein [Sabulicella rubraurantiaca]|uniref:Bug family tripartite tricarboxylate transporter substrate binding protein n=1 Tax=Sabulicella rubraurantiaca TaxID=2811429 RepID=UPI001A965B4B|nr:tripartite tricarboxylate transporter substrate-binding protein [Sabulicella rubraurantiaca]
MVGKIWRAALVAACAWAAATTPGAAQEFPIPGRPLMLMSGFPAGTAPDIYGRLIQPRLQQELGVPVVIDIRAGASGNIGMETAARSAPDGHTMLIATSAMLAINPAVFPRMPVDTQADFIPVATLFEAPNFMTVSTEQRPQFTDCKTVIAAARAAPGRLNYASTGIGASTHLAGAQFGAVTGIDIVHVPYRGGPFAMTALFQGDVDVFFYQTGPVIDFYRQGRVRLLGVTSATRVPAAPEVPTLAEACDLPGFDSTTWYGMLLPSRTPRAIVNRMTEIIMRIAREPEIESRVIAMGFTPAVADGEAMRARLARDVPIWRDVVNRVGARAE